MSLKKTPLYEEHIKLGGKMVEFAGWELPIQYVGLKKEHEQVRTKAGIFDVSHMGEIEVKGVEAQEFLQYLVTNNIESMDDESIIYTFMCYEDGGVVDDFLIYRKNKENYLLVVNASNADKDYEWIIKAAETFNVEVSNISDEVGEVAIQGPLAEDILDRHTDFDLKKIKPFKFKESVFIDDVECLVSRTGYTGEDGFEIYTSKEGIVKVFNSLIEEKDLMPAGLGARDTLRFEAGLPLYGNEMSKEINPLEAGQKFFVKFDKGEFIGREALFKDNEGGLKRRIAGFELLSRGIPREGYEVQKNGERIGYVTTGYMSPSLNKSIGFALLDIEEAKLGNEIDVIIRNKAIKAKVIKKRFYKK